MPGGPQHGQPHVVHDLGDRLPGHRPVTAMADGAPAPSLLIRPDGYVAWAGADPRPLQAALTRRFGPG